MKDTDKNKYSKLVLLVLGFIIWFYFFMLGRKGLVISYGLTDTFRVSYFTQMISEITSWNKRKFLLIYTILWWSATCAYFYYLWKYRDLMVKKITTFVKDLFDKI
jgi:hypothetical protein